MIVAGTPVDVRVQSWELLSDRPFPDHHLLTHLRRWESDRWELVARGTRVWESRVLFYSTRIFRFFNLKWKTYLNSFRQLAILLQSLSTNELSRALPWLVVISSFTRSLPDLMLSGTDIKLQYKLSSSGLVSSYSASWVYRANFPFNWSSHPSSGWLLGIILGR